MRPVRGGSEQEAIRGELLTRLVATRRLRTGARSESSNVPRSPYDCAFTTLSPAGPCAAVEEGRRFNRKVLSVKYLSDLLQAHQKISDFRSRM